MNRLANKHILLGVTGGIAAYKSADLVRRLRQAGAVVRVVMTRAATEFITPLTLQTLSGHAVRLELFDPGAESGMGHIELARWADAVLVAPASADFMARLAHGLADDLLTTLCLACAAPLVLAPAMNRQMWDNPATRDNRLLLQRRGVALFGPAEGEQACGEIGPGRMMEPEALVQRLAALFESDSLRGLSVLVSAGPTREAIDPVRFIGNRSSGKMGFAVAEEAVHAGAGVTLVSGPVALPTPPRVERVDVESAEQMYEAVLQRAPQCDIFISVAAVADYRPRERVPYKLKKTEARFTMELERTRDILAAVATLAAPPFTVGFAAETERLEEHAQAKRRLKSMDMIAVNQVGQPGIGFESEENALHLFWEGGDLMLSQAPKPRLARRLIAAVAERYHAKRHA